MRIFVIGLDDDLRDCIYNLFESSSESIVETHSSDGWLEIRLGNGSFLHASKQLGRAKRCRYNIILTDTEIDEEEYLYVLCPLISNYSFRGYE